MENVTIIFKTLTDILSVQAINVWSFLISLDGYSRVIDYITFMVLLAPLCHGLPQSGTLLGGPFAEFTVWWQTSHSGLRSSLFSLPHPMSPSKIW